MSEKQVEELMYDWVLEYAIDKQLDSVIQALRGKFSHLHLVSALLRAAVQLH
jgi:hypothetical protein